jgi:glyoxylate/hydroxypyruvate reductase A
LTINILFSAPENRWPEYERHLETAFADAGLDVDLSCDHAAADVDFIVFAPNGPVSDFSKFTKLKVVLGLWAGVESIVGNRTLQVPLTRMVDSGLTEGMVEWVTGHTLRYHLGFDQQILGQNGDWMPVFPPLARDRCVGILGLGALGTACGNALVNLNFNVMGWSRNQKSMPGIECHFGEAGLDNVLEKSEILILLLPQTAATNNLLNADRLARLPQGAFIINAGRGGLIEDAALQDALNSGHLAGATLDVFRTEPLPADDPYWKHAKVTVTPHVASETRAATASAAIVENIRRFQNGLSLNHLVDRQAGY